MNHFIGLKIQLQGNETIIHQFNCVKRCPLNGSAQSGATAAMCSCMVKYKVQPDSVFNISDAYCCYVNCVELLYSMMTCTFIFNFQRPLLTCHNPPLNISQILMIRPANIYSSDSLRMYLLSLSPIAQLQLNTRQRG